MSDLSPRLTSKDIVIEFLPHGVAATHIQHFYFNSTATGGTFKLRYNGELTAAITFSATPATLVSNINAALDALPNTTAGDLVASGSAITDITITATGLGNGWVTLLLEADGITGMTDGQPSYTTEVTTQGSSLVRISSDISSFNIEDTVETVDVTAISEFERTEIPVASTASFDMSIYKANQTWEYIVFAGNWGNIYVYPEGKVVGKQVFAIKGLIESVGEDYPDHEKVEKSISGMRLGPYVIPPNSIYRG